jgi:cell division control protein 6
VFPVEIERLELSKTDIDRMLSEVEKENLLFARKDLLDTLTFPSSIVGRKEKAMELVRLIAGYKKGHVVPFISVYGRSGAGKSTVIRFVCENLDDALCCFVNLRRAKTVFGCANLILGEMGEPSLKSAQGINVAVEKIQGAIESLSKGKRLFVLVLDEFDVLFYDKRGKPSDFIYKLLVMEEKLREKGVLSCIIVISNNVMADYEVDDRVRSRMGSTEVFFPAYTKKDVLEILRERSAKAFSAPVDPVVLEYCAEKSSDEHGDARRAIDLLRVAAEIASFKEEKLSNVHVDAATDQLQKDRVNLALSSASYHLKLACAALARITYLTSEAWHSTSVIYAQYCKIIRKDTRPLTYRRVSELLTELDNTGLVVSQTSSRGRHGYGTQYKLNISPEIVGNACFPDWWKNVVQKKKEHERKEEEKNIFLPTGKSHFGGLGKLLDTLEDESWKDFVGLDA